MKPAIPQLPTPPPPARPGRRERHRLETRERIFRAALRLFAERGFSTTTVEDITEAADVGKGTFFNYFPSKEHVLAMFGEMQLGKLERFVEEGKTGTQPMQQLLQRLMRALSEEPGRSAAMFRSFILAAFANEAVRTRLERNLDRGRHLLAELLELGQRRGEIRRDLKPLELARGIQQCFFGTMMVWSLRSPAPLAEWIGANFAILWPGIASGPAAPRRQKRP